MGHSGLGDLTLTCAGVASRNGLAIGGGEHATEVLPPAPLLPRPPSPPHPARAWDLSICRAVDAHLADWITLAEAIAGLLGRPWRDE